MNKIELKKQLQQMGIKVIEGNYVKKSQITKIIASDWTPWDDANADEATKKHYSTDYSKTKFRQFQKLEAFKREVQSLTGSIEIYLNDLEDSPEDKDLALVTKSSIKRILEEAEKVKKLRGEIDALEDLFHRQLTSRSPKA